MRWIGPFVLFFCLLLPAVVLAQEEAETVEGATENSADASDFGGSFPSGTVTFTSNPTETITINVAGDTAVEHDETFVITLTQSTRSLDIVTATAIGTIRNDDQATVTMSDGFAVAEGNSGDTIVTITATLDTDVAEGFSVGVSVHPDTATFGDDYGYTGSSMAFDGYVLNAHNSPGH